MKHNMTKFNSYHYLPSGLKDVGLWKEEMRLIPKGVDKFPPGKPINFKKYI